MALLPALLALAGAVQSAPSADEQALFAAFKGVCARVRSLPAMASAARRQGWQAVSPEAHPGLDLLVNGGRAEVLAREPDARLAGAQFRRKVGQRQLWLALSRYQDAEGAWSNGCRMYDFDAAAPIAPAALEALMGRPSTGTQPLPGGQTKYLWEPGWKSGHGVEVSFIAGQDDPLVRKFGLKGQILTAQAIGGF